MRIQLNIDNYGYKDKSKAKQMIGAIRNRLCSVDSITEIEAAQLIDIIKQGRSFTPAVMKGTTGDTWQSQQIIVVDLDNDEAAKDEEGKPLKDSQGKTIKKPIDNPITSQRALKLLKDHNIMPFCMYHTFSNSEALEKYRIVLILDSPITDFERALDLTGRVTHIFNAAEEHAADTSMKDAARVIFGSTPESVFFTSGQLTALGDLEKLPQEEKEQPTPPRPTEQTTKAPLNSISTGETRHFSDYKEYMHEKDIETMQRDLDLENFDLADYVKRTEPVHEHQRGNTTYLNPCPFCGHNDDFSIKAKTFCAFCSDNDHERKGGIIDYLMIKRGINQGEAIEVFKHEIMGYPILIYDKKTSTEKNIDEGMQQHLAEKEATSAPEESTPAPGSIEKTEAEIDKSIDSVFDAFLDKVQSKVYEPIPTGIKEIDKILKGGLTRAQQIFLAAAPGMGKTAFASWLFENMAKQGHEILYFNLEMQREQLLARSISRYVYLRTRRDLTALDILQGYKWTEEEKTAVKDAINAYKSDMGDRMKYNPGGEIKANLDDILKVMQDETAKLKAEGKKAPLVVIDYLHLLQSEKFLDDAETIKRAVQAFKDFAVQNDTIVFSIIANNRTSNKSGKSSMDSGRDTSSIEYGADIILSLSYEAIENGRKYAARNEEGKVIGYNKYTTEYIRYLKKKAYQEGKQPPKVCEKIALTINKGRFSQSDVSVYFDFDGAHSLFKETQATGNIDYSED